MALSQQEMATKLKEWFEKLDLLENKAKISGTEVKAKYEQMLNDLRSRMRVELGKLDKLRQLGEGGGEQVSANVEKVWNDTKRMVEQTFAKFK